MPLIGRMTSWGRRRSISNWRRCWSSGADRPDRPAPPGPPGPPGLSGPSQSEADQPGAGTGLSEPSGTGSTGPPEPALPLPAADRPGSAGIPVFELALRLLSRLAERSAVVLVIEDIHWADRSTLDLLAFLLANLGHDPVMVIATYRSDAVGPGHVLQRPLAELRRNRRAEFIDLQPFTRDEMVAQLTGLLGRTPADDMVELTWVRSDGNAFMVEELVAAVTRGLGDQLPPTLRHILDSRVALLSPPARHVLRLVAVGGEAVSHPLLASVADMAETSLMASLRECVEHQLLTVDRAGQSYKFRHSLLSEVLYDELLPGERTAYHSAYGRALSRSRPWWLTGRWPTGWPRPASPTTGGLPATPS